MIPETAKPASDVKHSSRHRLRPWRLMLLTLGALLGLLVMTLHRPVLRAWNERPLRFDSSRWKSTPADFSHESLRQRMVDDLLYSHPLMGKSKAEVEQLIGAPDRTAYFKNYDMVYLLGQERHSYFAMDSEWLVIRLDAEGRVAESSLVTD